MTQLRVRVNGAWKSLTTGLTPLASVPSVSLQSIDGGSTYYADHGYTMASSTLDNPNFFPIGVWFESVLSQSDIDKDLDTGLNTYVVLTSNSDMSLVRNNGMKAIVEGGQTGAGSETIGWFIADETDLTYGAGFDPNEGFTKQQEFVDALPQNDGRFYMANYGKAIVLPSFMADRYGAYFVNHFQHTVSCDFYWYTDHGINQPAGSPFDQASQFYRIYDADMTADQAKRACHYGNVVQHLRNKLVPARWEPVWGFVENGGPFNDNIQSEYMTPEIMTAAVWHMIIGGARGIIYFNHTFSGPFQGQHNFRDSNYASIQAAAKAVNAKVQALAPVINDNFAVNFVTVSPAASITSGIEVMAKYHGGKFYIFAGSRENGSTSQVATFTIPSGVGTTATVLNESRTRTITGGTFTDTFADGNAVHIYRIDP